MDGVVGVECRAPKAGALPGCATPRHEVRKDYKVLPNRTVAPSVQFGLHGMNPKTETVLTRTPCREAPANGKAKVLATSERIQADGGRAFQQLPEHCSTCEGTGHSAATAIQVETRRKRTFACRPVDRGFATLDRHDRSSNKRRNRLLEWHREFPRCILQELFGPPNQKARPRTILEAT